MSDFSVQCFLSKFLSVLFECRIFSPIFLSNFLSDLFQSPIFFSDFLSEIFECQIFLSDLFIRSICPINCPIFFLIYLNVRYFLSDIFVQVCCTCNVALLLIRPIVVFSPFSLRSPLLSSTQFYILFQQTINIIESFAFSTG